MIRTLLRVTVASAAICIGCLFYVTMTVPHWDPARRFGAWVSNGDIVASLTDPPAAPNADDAHRDLAWAGGDSLVLEVPASITIVPGTTPSISASGTPALVSRLELDQGVLRLHDEGFVMRRGSTHLVVSVTAPALVHVTLRSAARLDLPRLDQDRLDLHAEGAVHLHAAGRLHRLELSAEGASHADLSQVDLADARIDVAGASAVKAGPTGRADITVQGVGVVTLTRHPQVLTKSVEGVGAVIEAAPEPKADGDTNL